jgi:hypothetical protein
MLLRDDYHKQTVLISKSYGDSNQCTPCRGNPDQHITRFSCLVHVWPSTIRISRDPLIATFHVVVNRFKQIHCPWDEEFPTQSTAWRLTDPRVCTQLLSYNNQWGSGKKSSSCWQPANRLIEPISPACDRYVQYLLMGPTHWSLIDMGGGYNLGGFGFPHHTPRPSQPVISAFHLRVPLGLQLK